jgi:transcriptional regulator with XRE-family HTH domain
MRRPKIDRPKVRPPGWRPMTRPDALTSCHVRNDWDYEAFQRYILAAAAGVPGVHTQADIARIAGIPSASLLSKWFRGREQPSDASLRKIKEGFARHGVAVSLRDMAHLAGRTLEDEPGPDIAPPFVEVDPYVARVATVLDPEQGLTDEERGTVRAMLDLILPPLERLMRSRRRTRSA